MLVLSRKRNEEIVINGDIVINVVEIRGDRVRLGITASHTIPVHRKEVQDALERRESRQGSTPEAEPAKA